MGLARPIPPTLRRENTMTSHDRPVALVTGASRGLGLEVARLFACEGLPLILTARGAQALGDAEAELAAQTEVVALPGDVADRSHAQDLVRRGLERDRKSVV